jgi:hypothetical protein
MLLSGGRSSVTSPAFAYYGDLWSWDGSEWLKVGDTEERRDAHRLVFDPANKRVLMHGGFVSDSRGIQGPYREFGDVLALEGAKWQRVADEPNSMKMDHAIAFDRNRLIIFGRGITKSGSTMEFDGSKWETVSGDGPGDLVGFGSAQNSVTGDLVLFGGFTEEGAKNETWIYKNKKWRKGTGGPEALEAPVMAFDSKRKQVLLYGGRRTDQQYSLATWAWDGQTWSVVEKDGPGPFDMPCMAYDPKRDRVVLVGSPVSGPARTDTWEWDGRAWARIGGEG